MTQLAIPRRLTRAGADPFALVPWRTLDAEIPGKDGVPVFRQEGVEFPADFDDRDAAIVAQKYFYGPKEASGVDPAAGGREHSYRQLVGRVCGAIADWGADLGYFDDDGAVVFRDELIACSVLRLAAWNSPVWFNVGLSRSYGVKGSAHHWRWGKAQGKVIPCEDTYRWPQVSACYILSIEDSMESIMANATAEAMLFKYGSGVGSSLSNLRSSRERLAGGGRPSGPLSFFKVFDTIGGVVKSGGKTRRAAKLHNLATDHPDILEFVECKWKEELKARALIRGGYQADYNGEAYSTVAYQNTNIPVWASDAFMRAASAPGTPWQTIARTTGTMFNSAGEAMPCYDASWLLDRISECAWECGDPGMQFADTINSWHTVPSAGPIHASNPCAEYIHLDESACNLASANWLRFLGPDGHFDVPLFRHVCRLFLIAQEILVDAASYPTRAVAENSHRFRPLGLGPGNVGGFLMALGVPYDSDEGRTLAAGVQALLHGEAKRTSAELAGHMGPFDGYAADREAMLRVVDRHADAAAEVAAHMDATGPDFGPVAHLYNDLPTAIHEVWREVLALGRKHGFRNSQVTVAAPTGTIRYLMGCDTTGIEPEIGLVTYKNLAGGGVLKQANRLIRRTLEVLGYAGESLDTIPAYIEEHDTIEGAPGLRPEHLPVFDCAFPARPGGRSIRWQAHIEMAAALQPFLSGSASKTVNLPRESTPADIRAAYVLAWERGMKCISVYRDGSKDSQPVATTLDQLVGAAARSVPGSNGNGDGHTPEEAAPVRHKLPRTRTAITHHFEVDHHGVYATVGLYPDGRPGELFLTAAKEGSTLAGLLDTIGILTSYLLQYDIPLGPLVRKLEHTNFPPSGFTTDPVIRQVKSLVDYLARWLGLMFVPGYGIPGDRVKVWRDLPDRATDTAEGEDEGPAPTLTGELLLAARRSVVDLAVNGGPTTGTMVASVACDGPACDVCGALTNRVGRCFECSVCGTVLGNCGG